MSLNRDQIINLVLGRVGRREADTYLAAQAVTELQLIQDRLEGGPFMPWFLLSTEQSLASTASTRSIALPTDFLREYEDFPLYLYDTTASTPYTRMNKDEFDILESKFAGAAAQKPTDYALHGAEIDLFPTPDALVYNFRWKYYQKGATLSTPTSVNVWTANAADWLLAELGIVIAGHYKKDKDRLQQYIGERTLAYGRLLAFDEARKQQNRDAHMGDAQ